MSTLALWRDKLSYQPLSLGIIAMLTSGALALSNQLTHDGIRQAEQRDLQASLIQVLPEGFADNDLLNDTMKITGDDGKALTLYLSRQAGKVNGTVFQVSGRGYAGDVVVIIGIDATGTLLGARVVKAVKGGLEFFAAHRQEILEGK